MASTQWEYGEQNRATAKCLLTLTVPEAGGHDSSLVSLTMSHGSNKWRSLHFCSFLHWPNCFTCRHRAFDSSVFLPCGQQDTDLDKRILMWNYPITVLRQQIPKYQFWQKFTALLPNKLPCKVLKYSFVQYSLLKNDLCHFSTDKTSPVDGKIWSPSSTIPWRIVCCLISLYASSPLSDE